MSIFHHLYVTSVSLLSVSSVVCECCENTLWRLWGHGLRRVVLCMCLGVQVSHGASALPNTIPRRRVWEQPEAPHACLLFLWEGLSIRSFFHKPLLSLYSLQISSPHLPAPPWGNMLSCLHSCTREKALPHSFPHASQITEWTPLVSVEVKSFGEDQTFYKSHLFTCGGGAGVSLVPQCTCGGQRTMGGSHFSPSTA